MRLAVDAAEVVEELVAGDTSGLIPGVEDDPEADAPFKQTPVYIEEHALGAGPGTPATGPFLVSGLFQAPFDLGTADAGALALIVTNPWVDPEHPATFEFHAALQLSDHVGWEDQDTATLWRYDAEGNAEDLGIYTSNGDVQDVISGTLAPGEIVWWVLRKP